MNIARKLLEKQIQKDIEEMQKLRTKSAKGNLSYDELDRLHELEENTPKKLIQRNKMKP